MAATRVRLRVVPGARRPGLAGRHGDGWKIRVAAAPERGAANAAVVELLADALGIRPRDVRLVSGLGSRDKIVELDALTPCQVEQRLATADGKDE